MAWAASKVFRAYLKDVMDNTTALDLGSDAFKVALYNNTPTPSGDVTSANSAYNVDQWVTAQEVYQAGQWAQAGVALAGMSLDASVSATVFFDATDTASGSAATLASVYGCLVYDTTVGSPVASQGICFNYFGGTNSVTNGTLTVVWHANGLLRFTL